MQQITSINKVDAFVPGNLAYQAMALGREGISPHHCPHCKMGRSEFKNIDAIGLPWTMKEYTKVGWQSRESGNSQLGVKKEPWWQFIPLENYVVPLLHMLIGIGNQMLARFCNIVNEYVERLSPKEVNTQCKIQILQQIIKEKTTERKAWDQTDESKKHKPLLS
jgi:hypothetical protein